MKPRIRLKGFEGEWKLTSFGRNVKLRRGLTYSPTDVCSNGIRVLRSSNIDEDTFVVSKDDVFVNDKCVNIPFANQGDILITAANGSPRLVGKHCLIKTDDMNMVHGGFMLLASSPESAFYNASMGSGWYTSFKRIGISGGNGAIGNLDKTELENFKLYIPNSRCERDGLANYFKSLDELIQSTTQKVASLKQLKEASLISMFPQGNETTPRVRFKGFEGEWKSKLINNLLIERNELCPKSNEFPLKAFVAYKGIVDKGERYDRSSLVNDVENKLYKKTFYGDFIYSSNNLETGSIGINVFGKATISPVYSIFYCSNDADYNFIGYRLSMKSFIQQMVKWRQGVVYGQWRIHEKDFLQISLLVPTAEEQKTIGEYFRNIDTQITLQEQRLEKLKQLKSACLDQMFV